MKVLHLPFNIASQASITVLALRDLGIEARGLVRNFSSIQDHRGIATVDWFGRPNAVSRLWRGVRWRLKLAAAIRWAEVIHWHWGDSTWRGIDLRLAAALRKPRLVEFWGDDLRDPKVAMRDNPFITRMYEQNPELAESRGLTAQQMFARYRFACLIPGYELADYLDSGLFEGYYQTRQRVLVDTFTPAYPVAQNERPVLVHSPSDKARKGTESVLGAVERLAKSHRFEFKLVHGMARKQALETVAGCDIFLDQFVIGSEGLASLEAMAMGKPVVCFFKRSMQLRYPPGLPIVNADQNNLAAVLEALLQDGQRRRDLGVHGRRYVEEYHDAKKLGAELIGIYEDVTAIEAGRKNPGSSPNWRSLRPADAKGEP